MTKVASIIAAFLIAAAALPAGAQSLAITYTSIPDGQSAVPRQDSLILEFDRSLAFLTQFNRVLIEPRASVFRRYSFYDGGRRMTFALSHAAATDFSVVAYGLRGRDGSRMARPFVFNYTTAASIGTHRVSGAVRFEPVRSISPPASVGAMAMSLIESDGVASKEGGAVVQTWSPGESPFTRSTQLESMFAYERTVVFLVNRYDLDPERWTTRTASDVDAVGAFALRHVRSGTFFPLVVTFGDPDGLTISALGFLDSAGLLEPGSISVDGSLDGLTLTSYSLGLATALEGVEVASARAARARPGMELTGVSTPSVHPDGTALTWTYHFSGTPSTSVSVTMNAIYLEVAITPSEAQETLPHLSILDSPAVMLHAEEAGGRAFRDAYTGAVSSASLSMREIVGEVRTVPIWTVRYEAGDASNEFHFNAISGERVHPGQIGTHARETVTGFHAGPPYPNPTSGMATVPIVTDVPTVIRIDVYDSLGRLRTTAFEGRLTAGAHRIRVDMALWPTGPAFLRIEANEHVATHPLIVIR